MYDVHFVPEALRDLQAIRSYLGEECLNPEAATKTLTAILEATHRLRTFPQSGVEFSPIGISTPYRSLLCGQYRIFYYLETNTARIIRVLYTRRDCTRILFG